MTEAYVWAWEFSKDTVNQRVFSTGSAPDGDYWDVVVERIYKHMAHIFRLSVSCRSGALRVEGQVESERIKADVLDAIQSYAVATSVLQQIEVTAKFTPATELRPDETRYELAAVPDGETSVRRFPVIAADLPPTRGEAFRFTVDLSRTKHAETDGTDFTVTDLDANWSEVDFEVKVLSAELRFDAAGSAKFIRVVRDRSSIAAVFEATVLDDTTSDEVTILAQFLYKTRFSGMARRAFPIAKSVRKPAPVSDPTVAHSGQDGFFDGQLQAVPAALTILINSIRDTRSYFWTSFTQHGQKDGGGSLSDVIDLGSDGKTLAHSMLKNCPNFEPGKHESNLRGIGELIWQKTPDVFKELYWDLTAHLGGDFSIQIVTDEPYVPWELMRPTSKGRSHACDHLCMAHPISRWPTKQQRGMRNQLNPGIFATCVPDYRGNDALPEAIAERDFLVSKFGAKLIGTSRAEFIAYLSDKMPDDPVSVLHFAGHGKAGDDDDPPSIKMHDDQVTIWDMHSGVSLGVRDKSFVVLNACEVGQGKVTIGLANGWASTLIEREFAGVVAPIWSVEDEPASTVVRTFLRSLKDGATVGDAMLAARTLERSKSSTPFAYFCYGDVNAKIAADRVGNRL